MSTTPQFKRFLGDKALAAEHLGLARSLMQRTRYYLGKLDGGKTWTLPSGAVIRTQVSGGLEVVTIDVRRVGGKPEYVIPMPLHGIVAVPISSLYPEGIPGSRGVEFGAYVFESTTDIEDRPFTPYYYTGAYRPEDSEAKIEPYIARFSGFTGKVRSAPPLLKEPLKYGSMDWRGHSVDGVPTVVLSWDAPGGNRLVAEMPSLTDLGMPGHVAPYPDFEFDMYDSLSPAFRMYGRTIYRDGKEYVRTPNNCRIHAAAIQKDAEGKEWVVAICANPAETAWALFGSIDGYSYYISQKDPITGLRGGRTVPSLFCREIVIARKAPKPGAAVVATDGWITLGVFEPDEYASVPPPTPSDPADPAFAGEQPLHTFSWFFNDDGTEAACVRGIRFVGTVVKASIDVTSGVATREIEWGIRSNYNAESRIVTGAEYPHEIADTDRFLIGVDYVDGVITPLYMVANYSHDYSYLQCGETTYKVQGFMNLLCGDIRCGIFVIEVVHQSELKMTTAIVRKDFPPETIRTVALTSSGFTNPPGDTDPPDIDSWHDRYGYGPEYSVYEAFIEELYPGSGGYPLGSPPSVPIPAASIVAPKILDVVQIDESLPSPVPPIFPVTSNPGQQIGVYSAAPPTYGMRNIADKSSTYLYRRITRHHGAAGAISSPADSSYAPPPRTAIATSLDRKRALVTVDFETPQHLHPSGYRGPGKVSVLLDEDWVELIGMSGNLPYLDKPGVV